MPPAPSRTGSLRIVLATESFLPYLSGVTVSVDALARGLGAAGHEVLVVAPRPARGVAPQNVGSPGPEPAYAWLDSYELPGIVPTGYRMPWPNPAAHGWREAKAFGPQIVHAHSPFVSGLLARRLARSGDAPLVFTHHTRFADYGHYLGPLAGPATALTAAYLRRFWAGCDAIVAPSADLRDEIRGLLPVRRQGRVQVIATGLDVDGIRSLAPVDPRADGNWPETSTVLVSLGRLALEKSPDLLLDAVARAMLTAPQLRLLVIGGGAAEAELRERGRRPDLVGRVAFTGSLPRPQALARLAGGDAFVFTSRTETQGLVLAEALAAGLPAVAVDGPGVRDSIRDGIDGVVVPAEPSDSLVERLASAMAHLAIDEASRRRMAERARRDADRFALSARIGETEALYRSLLR